IVSNASEDLPEPLTPVTTVISLCGISTLTLFRLCVRAPRMRSDSESAVSGVLEVMSSFVAKGMNLDGALHALCLNFKLYVQEKFGANAGRGGLYIRQMNRRHRELAYLQWSLILHDITRQISARYCVRYSSFDDVGGRPGGCKLGGAQTQCE